MPDPIFSHPRLAAIYDAFDGTRDDLLHYLKMAQEFQAQSILDVGCGTGCLTILLARHGFKVFGLDPARASLDVARQKPDSDKIHWIEGETSVLANLEVDLAFMTGNVAQVFIQDKDWEETLRQIHSSLNPQGYLVFETRDPSRKAWKRWTKENTCQQKDIPGVGPVTGYIDRLEEELDLVHFRWNYEFHQDGTILSSESTLKFREKDALIQSLEKTGFTVQEIRDAPDRPQQEFVFVARTQAR